jgi:hypothetical protein
MLLSTGMFRPSWCRLVERSDDVVEVAQNLTVHFGESFLSAGLGGGDRLQRLLPLLVVLRQEPAGGEEQRTVRHASLNLILMGQKLFQRWT